MTEGSIVRLSRRVAVATLKPLPPPLTDLKLSLAGVDQELAQRDIYGKVVEDEALSGNECRIRFTAVPPEVKAYFQSHIQHAEGR
jgi:hypothetical protein